ncbi:MAG: DUF3825 domain-containing protein [Clostridia bacterium]|nr:DUF3825 domain-containing protein [Clostridia bacterium]
MKYSKQRRDDRAMTLQQQCEIYDILSKYYEQGERVTHAMLISHLRENNVRAGDFGFSSGLEFTQSLACFLEHEKVVPRPDAPPIWYVTIGKRPLDNEQKAAVDEPVEEEGKTTLPLATEEQLAAANLPAEMTDENIIRFPMSAQRGLKGFLVGDRNNSDLLSEEEMRTVQRDYATAIAAGTVYFDAENANSFVIQLSLRAQDGSFLKINIARSAEGYNYPFYVKYAGRDTSRSVDRKGFATSADPKDALYRFAYLGSEDQFYCSLIREVRPESWSFTGDPGDHTILHNYLRYTFWRLQEEGKIWFGTDKNGKAFATFNTGLLSRNQSQDVLAFFEENIGTATSKWKFVCFCSADSAETNQRRCHKTVLFCFGKEPPIAAYFSKMDDLIYAPKAQLSISYDHIIRDNCERFPLDFLKDLCRHSTSAKAVIREIEAETRRAEKKALYRELGSIIADSSIIAPEFKARLDGEAERACRRAARNYKYAVPSFYPARQVMSLLLPLSFRIPKEEEDLYQAEEPNLVLVLERVDSEENGQDLYIGQTVLDLSMAYMDARLLCAPDSEWLNPDRIADLNSRPQFAAWNAPAVDEEDDMLFLDEFLLESVQSEPDDLFE